MKVIGATAFVGGIALGCFIYDYFLGAPTPQEAPADVPESSPDPASVAMVLLIRQDLKMRRGKMGAQFGHGSLGAFLKVAKHYPPLGMAWAEGNSIKKFFYVPNQDEMERIEELARERGYLTKIIADAGRTQIEAGSLTVLAIAPVPLDDVKTLVQGLKPVP
jgi:PTH2 family peptidyl-tRNA hydrolase